MTRLAEEQATPATHQLLGGADVVVAHVSKSYEGGIAAVADVSLHVRPGEFLLITGPSGSGKSTLLNLIGSLDRPDAGSIVVDGISVPDLANPTDYRRHVVGFIFQLHHLLPQLTARMNVEVPLIATGVHRTARHRLALDLLGEVGMAKRAEHTPAQLSGGERQCVAVARALANDPRLVLADEPTGALDSAGARRVMDLLAKIRETRGATLITVSHDPEMGARADHVVRLVDGRVAGAEKSV